MENRYLETRIVEDLQEKMVFIGGPRQVGKTTVAQHIGKQQYAHPQYLNWDFGQHRQDILNYHFDSNADVLIFDEIHKYKQWKNYLKGLYDTHKKQFHIIVTGSARLDLYRKGGDSLLGRYHYYRLHPFSVAEILGTTHSSTPLEELTFQNSTKKVTESFAALYHFGGFPEPFLKQEERFLRRWQSERVDRLVREDIRDVELVRDISGLQILVSMLPGIVGSQLSVNSLREDLQVAHKTASLWVDILERFYYHFRIPAYAHRAISSLRKEQKLYLWDWSEVKNAGARLENMVAAHLLKFTHFLQDTEGWKAELLYLRDIEGHEVDFLITIDRKPWFAVEVKKSDAQPSKSLRYFTKKLDIPFSYHIVESVNKDYQQEGVRVMSVEKFLTSLV